MPHSVIPAGAPSPRPRRAVAAGLAWCAVGRMAAAQLPGVAVDPHLVVLSSAAPTGELTVFNTRGTAAEYDVSLRYGYAGTDGAGRPTVHLADDSTGPSVAGGGGSAAAWVTPYPGRFILQPGTWQTIRFAARPGTPLSDGEYWARITVRARELAPPAPLVVAARAAAGVRATLAIETASVLPLLYRAGAVRTGVAVDSLWAAPSPEDPDSLVVGAVLRRTGNAAFLGSVAVAVYDSTGGEAARLERTIAVYRDASPRWRIPRPHAGAPGDWRVALTIRTDRRDIPERLVLPSATVRRVTGVQQAQ